MKTIINKTELPKHLFVSSTDGTLHDTRKTDWSKTPLRANYCFSHGSIKTLADVKATIRNGAYAWPGGYPLFFATRDGAALCFDCVCKNFRQVVWDFMHNTSTGWRVEACAINYEDSELTCESCSSHIESAYGQAE